MVWGRESADVFSSLVSAAKEPKFRNRSSPWQRVAARVRRERERERASKWRRVVPGPCHPEELWPTEKKIVSEVRIKIDQRTLPRKNPLLAKGHPHRPAEKRQLAAVVIGKFATRALATLCVRVRVCVCVCAQRNAKSGRTLHQIEREDRPLCIRDCLSVFACLPFFRHFLPMD